jgi:hypothetical protein
MATAAAVNDGAVKSTKNARVYFSGFLLNSFRYDLTFQHYYIYYIYFHTIFIAFINSDFGPSLGPTPEMQYVSKTQVSILGNTHVCYRYVFHGWSWAT